VLSPYVAFAIVIAESVSVSVLITPHADFICEQLRSLDCSPVAPSYTVARWSSAAYILVSREYGHDFRLEPTDPCTELASAASVSPSHCSSVSRSRWISLGRSGIFVAGGVSPMRRRTYLGFGSASWCVLLSSRQFHSLFSRMPVPSHLSYSCLT
jgi:hypothetical protein